MGDLVRRFFAPLQAIDWPKAFCLIAQSQCAKLETPLPYKLQWHFQLLSSLAMSSASSALIQTLANNGVEVIFSLSGNQIMPLYDACIDANIRIIHTRHEGAAE